jgi:NADPH2:quinone reductase
MLGVRAPRDRGFGCDVAGVVEEIGPEVTRFHPGDRVFGDMFTFGLGSFAEFKCVSERALLTIPEGMSFEHASTFPHAAILAVQGLRRRDGRTPGPGDRVLIGGASGNVGPFAVQIAKALGARVIATAGGAEKLAIAREAGADVAVDYRAEDWVAAVKHATDGRGADVIYDSVGGDITDKSLKCIAWNGRLLVIGFASGDIPAVKLNRVLLKNIAIVGLHWGAHVQHEPARIQETFAALFDLYAAGKIRPVVFARYGLDDLPAALEALGSRRSYGKIVVTP